MVQRKKYVMTGEHCAEDLHEKKGELNPGFEQDEPKRKVSIASSPTIDGNDERQRKISSSSNQSKPKSILVNNDNFSHLSSHADGRTFSIYSGDENRRQSMAYDQGVPAEESWWFLLCTKCRQKETGPGWEPPHWQTFCPYPFCPTYRHMARVFSLFLLGILAWGVIYAIIGSDAAPGGQLFDIAVLCIAAHFGGWIFHMATMPPLVGMLAVGILYQNVGLINVHGKYNGVISELRKVALVVILTRAGLDLDAGAMKRLCVTVLKLGIVPWIVECLIVTALSHYFLDLPWMWGLLLGSIVAAVSPAVVVPCLIRLRNKGYGVAKGIPTLIIAVSGIDDALSVAAFGIIHSAMFSSNSLAYEILLGPLSILIGLGFGFAWGYLAKYVPEKEDPFVVPLRIMMLLGGGLIAILGSELLEFGGAGPLGCIAAAFISCYGWSKQGWDVEDNPVATAFEIFWMIFEPILFGLTGTQIKINEMDGYMVGIGASILVAGILLRIIITCLIAVGSKLNIKEKIFCALSWMSKASVQAALGPVALDIVRERGIDESVYAQKVLTICVMSIILTAPIGAILITMTGSKLLNKTSEPIIMEGWRRSARPSLRDITIFTEDFDDMDDSRSIERPSIVVSDQPMNVS
ncbi:sodium/hydrogen exchanger 9B2 isoform X2 [Cimex lectularius]|uniref:Cation/H+ exchanger transmembrane domain-containing protein n=2 Tax=Cimex lectularius TaxID=79782 RepID=A0A8I6SFU8_CIMLE|nr:sodium/hydrogen exchanger 9B2 isoform X2 [Cimex lectularius]